MGKRQNAPTPIGGTGSPAVCPGWGLLRCLICGLAPHGLRMATRATSIRGRKTGLGGCLLHLYS